MRCTRIVIALILTSALILIFPIVTSAASDVTDLYLYSVNAKFIADNAHFETYYPTDNENGSFSLTIQNPQTFDGKEYTLESTGFIFYPNTDDAVYDLEEGYIYTYNFEVRYRNVVNPAGLFFTFGVCTEDMTAFESLSDCTYTYTFSGGWYIYLVTSVVNVEKGFSWGTINDSNNRFIGLDVTGNWSGDCIIRNVTQKETKAIGENAYYQASIDAIYDLQDGIEGFKNDVKTELENMPESEYNWVYNAVDVAGSQDTIKSIEGDVNDMIEEVKVRVTDFYQLLSSFVVEKPKIYFGNWYIPFLDINITSLPEVAPYMSGGYFYPLDMLNTMNSGIVEWLDIAKIFVRMCILVTFLGTVIYKLLKIEWWIK